MLCPFCPELEPPPPERFPPPPLLDEPRPEPNPVLLELPSPIPLLPFNRLLELVVRLLELLLVTFVPPNRVDKVACISTAWPFFTW